MNNRVRAARPVHGGRRGVRTDPRLSGQLDVPVHVHLHETAREVEDAMRETGERPFARLSRLGLVNPRLAAVHMTELLRTRSRRWPTRGASVVHCPESNLKLASGVCPAPRLAAAGVNVALGTDGAASNNDLDMLGEMRTARPPRKLGERDATASPAGQVLRMATLGGARSLGLGDRIGSLEPGKSADVVAIDLRGPTPSRSTTPSRRSCTRRPGLMCARCGWPAPGRAKR